MFVRNCPGSQSASSRSKLKAWPEPVRAGVPLPPGTVHPGFGHRRSRGPVLVEDLPPLGVDVVHLVPVPERVSAGRQRPFSQGGPAGQRLGQVLGQAVGHVHAEAVDAAIGPEPDRGQEVLPDLAVGPVQVRLGHGEQVQVPLPVAGPGPDRFAADRFPVRRRLRPVRAGPVAENVPVPGGRSLRGGQRLPEPQVPARGVVRHDVDDDLDPGGMQPRGHLVEVRERAQARVDIAVVVDVVAAVDQGRGVKRAQPDRIDPQRGQVRDARDDPPQVADPVPVGVGEAARIDLVDDGAAPPVGVCRAAVGLPNDGACFRACFRHESPSVARDRAGRPRISRATGPARAARPRSPRTPTEPGRRRAAGPRPARQWAARCRRTRRARWPPAGGSC